ncbi:hypothetical protein [Gloeobacter kilaueensis]|uniref:Uncharacterized protein n=1 Tax=Gloeobacter kilaueensis (strain ATCC BAA-2537 / CCAP 1431/1 / ULC 316 / JS1) TaxID=1183438 RepID=U5QNN8_GLOK1|nr:hypothetical protein [Gloeobacter kilaueensis]AGY60602.1 hypothetical protein GKIL_4356 [Gloeobacter kilaueensis JS1]
MTIKQLRNSPMMAHLIDALEAGQDIGHNGRLVFVMVARHFLKPEELLKYLQKDPNCSEAEARSLYQQVEEREYSPPRRERILEFQKQQDFPICPDPDNPDSCNVYRELEFPQEVYDKISSYHEQKSEH